MPLNANSTDIEVMQRVAAYDSKALEILYNRYSPILFTLIKKIASDTSFAEEILTEVFVIIWRKVHLFDIYSGNVYTWLITLARNKAVDMVRRSRSNKTDVEEAGTSTGKTNFKMPEYTDEFEDRFIVPKLSKLIDALDLTTAFSIKSSVESALNKLTDAQQYVIYLAYYEGLTQKEIAGKLNIPYVTVKSKIKIASVNLREFLLKGDS